MSKNPHNLEHLFVLPYYTLAASKNQPQYITCRPDDRRTLSIAILKTRTKVYICISYVLIIGHWVQI